MPAYYSIVNQSVKRSLPNQLFLERTKIMNYANLIKLAKGNSTVAKDTEFGLDDSPSGVEIKNALKEVMAEDRQKTVKAAALEILEIHKMATAKQEHLVAMIRSARKTEASAKAQLKEINQSKDHAGKTSNYLPLMQSIGLNIPFELLIENEALVHGIEPKTVVKRVRKAT